MYFINLIGLGLLNHSGLILTEFIFFKLVVANFINCYNNMIIKELLRIKEYKLDTITDTNNTNYSIYQKFLKIIKF